VNASKESIAAGRDIELAIQGDNNQIYVAPGATHSKLGTEGMDLPGRPIIECNPLDLEVHHAIRTDQTPDSELPFYVPRPHDLRLQELVAEVRGGRSRMVVLVGGSSTGKTRACWEAVQPLAEEGWKLWHPFDPGRVDAALDGLCRVGPKSVVWLNEAQHYLASTEAGERIAAALRALLADPSRGPVLVLGTLWPRYWDELTALASEGPDPHSQARELLAGRDLRVPECFTGRQLDAVLTASDVDDRLRLALEQAADGRIAQFLAGAPALVTRYKNASPAARAVLDAAIDARRLGCGVHVPMGLLEAAAPWYLTEDEFYALNDDWFEQALAYTARPVHGGTAALRRVPARPGRPALAGSPVYRLADYLEQYAANDDQRRHEPPELWDALVARIEDPKDLLRIEKVAHNLGLRKHAVLAMRRAAESNDIEALNEFSRALLAAERYDLAEPYLLRAAETGSESAWWRLAQHGDNEQRTVWCRRLVEAANQPRMTDLAPMLHGDGLVESAIGWLTPGAERGETAALGALAYLLQSADRAHDAVQLLSPHAESNPDIAQMLAYALEQIGQDDEAKRLWRQLALSGDWWASLHYAELLSQQSEIEQAIEVLRRGFEQNDGRVYKELATSLEKCGRLDEAYDVLVQAIRLHYGKALRQLEGFADRHGLLERLAQSLSELVADQPAGPDSLVQVRFALAKTLWQVGRTAEAITTYEQLASDGYLHSKVELTSLYVRDGLTPDAIALWLQAANNGSAEAQYHLSKILNEAGRTQDSLGWLRRSAEQGFETAIRTLIDGHNLNERDNADREFLIRFALAGQKDVLRRIVSDDNLTDILRVVAPQIGRMKAQIPWRAFCDAGFTHEVRDWAWDQLRSNAYRAFDTWLEFLRYQDRHSEADHLGRYGLTPSGVPAPEWQWEEILRAVP
jgi:Flp pilus assembly protein TadD